MTSTNKVYDDVTWKEFSQDMKELRQQRMAENIEKSEAHDDGGWVKHTQWHWSRTVAGQRLDYWPTKMKWKHGQRFGRGDVSKFIAKMEGLK